MFVFQRPTQPQQHYSPWASTSYDAPSPYFRGCRQPSAHSSPFFGYEQSDDDDSDSLGYSYYDSIRRIEEQRILEEKQARRRAYEEAILAARRQENAQQQAREAYIAHVHKQQELARQQAVREYQRREDERRQRLQQQQAARAELTMDQSAFLQSLFGYAPQTNAVQDSQRTSTKHDRTPYHLPQSRQVEFHVHTPVPSRPAMSPKQAVHVIEHHAKVHLTVKHNVQAVESIKTQLAQAKNHFAKPEVLQFDATKSSESSPVLAYAATNKPLQAYEEQLTRLLVSLDAIPTHGSTTVKGARKALAVEIEEELTKLDDLKREIYKAQQAVQHEVENQEKKDKEDVQTMLLPLSSATAESSDESHDIVMQESIAVEDPASSIPGDSAVLVPTDTDPTPIPAPSQSDPTKPAPSSPRPASVTVSDDDDENMDADIEVIPLPAADDVNNTQSAEAKEGTVLDGHSETETAPDESSLPIDVTTSDDEVQPTLVDARSASSPSLTADRESGLHFTEAASTDKPETVEMVSDEESSDGSFEML